jgi:hypothetical protein
MLKNVKKCQNFALKALFASLEGRRGNDFGKKEETSGRNIEVWEGRSLEVIFSS